MAKEKEVVAELSEAVERLSEKLEEMRQWESGVRGQEGRGGGGPASLPRRLLPRACLREDLGLCRQL